MRGFSLICPRPACICVTKRREWFIFTELELGLWQVEHVPRQLEVFFFSWMAAAFPCICFIEPSHVKNELPVTVNIQTQPFFPSWSTYPDCGGSRKGWYNPLQVHSGHISQLLPGQEEFIVGGLDLFKWILFSSVTPRSLEFHNPPPPRCVSNNLTLSPEYRSVLSGLKCWLGQVWNIRVQWFGPAPNFMLIFTIRIFFGPHIKTVWEARTQTARMRQS